MAEPTLVRIVFQSGGDTGLWAPVDAGDVSGAPGTDGYTPVKGVDYFDGASGAPGAKGDTGNAGSQGVQGTPGAVGPKGDTGEGGAAGAQGIQGIQGGAGLQGLPGAKGDTGNQGIQGNPGTQGIQGVKGDTGNAGSQGPAGADSTVPGPKGDTGTAGAQGNPGAQGSPGNNAPSYGALANGTTAMAFATAATRKVTPTALATFTTTVPAAGTECTLIILTSGTSSFTITFGTGFKPTATLATGTTSARVFVIHWISDGTNLYEAGRTAAMVA